MLSLSHLFEDGLKTDQDFYQKVQDIAFEAVMSENIELVETLSKYLNLDINDDNVSEIMEVIDPILAGAGLAGTYTGFNAIERSKRDAKRAADNFEDFSQVGEDNDKFKKPVKSLAYQLGVGKREKRSDLAIQRSIPHQLYRHFTTIPRLAIEKIGQTNFGKAITSGFDKAKKTEIGKKVFEKINNARDDIGSKLIRSGTVKFKKGNERSGLNRINLGQSISSKHLNFKNNQRRLNKVN